MPYTLVPMQPPPLVDVLENALTMVEKGDSILRAIYVGTDLLLPESAEYEERAELRNEVMDLVKDVIGSDSITNWEERRFRTRGAKVRAIKQAINVQRKTLV